LYTAGVASGIDEGIVLARQAIAGGAAHAKIKEFVAATRRLADAG
jgi:anthranilate phosphoribosyltransferase